jgi:hypothetical protein
VPAIEKDLCVADCVTTLLPVIELLLVAVPTACVQFQPLGLRKAKLMADGIVTRRQLKSAFVRPFLVSFKQ